MLSVDKCSECLFQGVRIRTIYLKITYCSFFLSLGFVLQDVNCILMIFFFFKAQRFVQNHLNIVVFFKTNVNDSKDEQLAILRPSF